MIITQGLKEKLAENKNSFICVLLAQPRSGIRQILDDLCVKLINQAHCVVLLAVRLGGSCVFINLPSSG
jgi:hypothetical protein